jgi:hypothetical protein
MVDDSCRPGDDNARRLRAPFLTRALEVVLRVVELYAAERNIQTHPDPLQSADPLGGVANASEGLPAGSASASLTISERPGRIAQSASESNPPGDEPVDPGDPATKPPRGGWTNGNSTSAQIRAGAVEYLRQKGARASGREIWEALKAKGMVINTKDPSALVSSRIGRSPLFDHTYAGYGLREWSDREGSSQDGSLEPPESPGRFVLRPADRDPPQRTRPRWTWTHSQSSQIRVEAADYLRQRGKRATGGEIYKAIASRGVKVSGKQPSSRVCATLSASDIFDHSSEGYGLREWSDSVTEA